jgi:hypothetical protein
MAQGYEPKAKTTRSGSSSSTFAIANGTARVPAGNSVMCSISMGMARSTASSAAESHGQATSLGSPVPAELLVPRTQIRNR